MPAFAPVRVSQVPLHNESMRLYLTMLVGLHIGLGYKQNVEYQGKVSLLFIAIQ